MSDIYLNPETWDFEVVDGDLVFLQTKEEECTQGVLMTLKTHRGEWFKDIKYGVPWTSNDNNPIQILGEVPKGVFDNYIRNGILSNPEVNGIKLYESTIDPYSGKVTVNATIDTPTGDITFTAEI